MTIALDQIDVPSKRRSAKAPKSRKAIPIRVERLLWARSAGRCQYAGCNKSLIGDQVSGTENANGAYVAHIISAEPDGPRGDPELSPLLATDPSNLMLVCDVHHRVFDRDKEAEHPIDVLRERKRRHEERIEIVTAIDEDRGSHVIRYAASIGPNEAHAVENDLKLAMLPERYPINGGWVNLDIVNLPYPDHEPEYWRVHLRNLRDGFRDRIRGRLERQEIKRLTLFGLAPIPLLIELGRLASDIANVEVRQLLRHPKGWRWDDDGPPVILTVGSKMVDAPTVALKLEISAPIDDDRVCKVLGPDVAVWSISASEPHNDIIRSRDDLAGFAKAFRGTLDAIKTAHGEDVTIHLFPAIPVSAAVEVGRSWQPKAHPPLRIYDQNRTLGGFVHVHDVALNDGTLR